MLHKKLQQAIEREDWDSAKQIDALLQSKIDRHIKMQQAKLNSQLIQSQILKNHAEAAKASKDKNVGITALAAPIITALVALAAFIKTFYEKH